MKQFFVIGDDAAHSAEIREMEMDDIWTGSGPDDSGWTYQNICGAHGRVIDQANTEEEANKIMTNYLKCDSVKTGRYCYSHNRF
jgi:hypothetical protein